MFNSKVLANLGDFKSFCSFHFLSIAMFLCMHFIFVCGAQNATQTMLVINKSPFVSTEHYIMTVRCTATRLSQTVKFARHMGKSIGPSELQTKGSVHY